MPAVAAILILAPLAYIKVVAVKFIIQVEQNYEVKCNILYILLYYMCMIGYSMMVNY